jgi:hypothetical protein
MHSNNSDVAVVDVVDCGSDGGGSAQLRLDRCGGGVIGAATGSGVGGRIGRRRRGSSIGAVGRCGRGVLARRDDDGSGAVWEASAGADQTESFDLLMA